MQMFLAKLELKILELVKVSTVRVVVLRVKEIIGAGSSWREEF